MALDISKMTGQFVMFVFEFLDCCVVTVIFFSICAQSLTLSVLYVQVSWTLGTMFLLLIHSWPSKLRKKVYIELHCRLINFTGLYIMLFSAVL